MLSFSVPLVLSALSFRRYGVDVVAEEDERGLIDNANGAVQLLGALFGREVELDLESENLGV